jgi:hypothetical protein
MPMMKSEQAELQNKDLITRSTTSITFIKLCSSSWLAKTLDTTSITFISYVVVVG